MVRWDLYTIKHAVSIYLGRSSESDTDWETEVLVDITNNVILEWNVVGETEPTNQQLNDGWEAAKLVYYKNLQLLKLTSQFKEFSKTGNGGLETSILDSESTPIRVDVRLGDTKNDIFSYDIAHRLMVRNSMPTMPFVDYYNKEHSVTAVELETILYECAAYGLQQMQKKWAKRAAIEACTTVEQVLLIDWNSVES